MYVLGLLLILKITSCDITYSVSSPDKSTPLLPLHGARHIAKQIDKASSFYTTYTDHILPGADTVLLNKSEETQQFHGIIEARKGGRYYTRSSVVVSPCFIKEEEASDLFFEDIPRNFTAGSPALIPCLLSGLPAPATSVYRCSSKFDCENSTKLHGFKRSRDGHTIITTTTEDQSGWYRCIGTNICGSVTTNPIFINISSISHKESGYVISRRTDTSSFFHHIEEQFNYETKDVSRTLTELQLWQLDGTYSDEGLYVDNKAIHLFYYPTHSSPTTSFNEMTFTDYLPVKDYGAVTHNNSFVTQFSKSPYTSSTSIILKFSTEVVSPPTISAPRWTTYGNTILSDPASLTIVFRASLHHTYNHTANLRFYRNTVRLQEDWKTTFRLTEGSISVTIATPIKLDSGYYQCGVMYDVLYMSAATYVNVSASNQDSGRAEHITATSARLSWDLPGQYSGEAVVFLSNRPAFPADNTSVSLTKLSPYTEYTWYIATPHLTPLVDEHTFRTLAAVPETTVGNMSVVRSETALSLTWEAVPQERWYDDHISFKILASASNLGAPTKEILSKSNSARVPDLSPATPYNISVTVCNSLGCSQHASTLTTLTTHTLLPRPLVELLHVSRHYADLDVREVPEEGVTTFMFLTPGTLCGNDSGDVKIDSSSSGDVKIATPSARVGRLDMNSWYSVKVHTTNGYSRSPWSDCLTFQTEFDWLLITVPLCCVVSVLVLGVLLRATVRHRYPDLFNKLRQALEPRYMPVVLPGEEWETSNDVKIIHTRTETCEV